MLSFHPEDLLRFDINPIIVVFSIPFLIAITLIILKLVYSRKKYKCTECETVFKPKFWHTKLGHYSNFPDGQDQYCPKCKKVNRCKFYEE